MDENFSRLTVLLIIGDESHMYKDKLDEYIAGMKEQSILLGREISDLEIAIGD